MNLPAGACICLDGSGGPGQSLALGDVLGQSLPLLLLNAAPLHCWALLLATLLGQNSLCPKLSLLLFSEPCRRLLATCSCAVMLPTFSERSKSAGSLLIFHNVTGNCGRLLSMLRGVVVSGCTKSSLTCLSLLSGPSMTVNSGGCGKAMSGPTHLQVAEQRSFTAKML